MTNINHWNKGGRPTKYKSEYIEQGYKLAVLGATIPQIADFFEVSHETIYEWMRKHPKFSDAINKGRTQMDMEVAERLLHKAQGYSHKETKVFYDSKTGQIVEHEVDKHYAPDTTAAIFWLKNRQPELWRDKQEVESKNLHAVVNPEDAKWTIEFINAEDKEEKDD